MTPSNTVFARPHDAGGYSILHNDTGMPVTRLDASVYPIGSEFGARYEHAEGIRLSREDVTAAGIDFEYPLAPAPTFTTALDAYRVAATADERLVAYEAMCQHLAAETDEDGDVESAVSDVLARENLPRVSLTDEEIRSRCTLAVTVDRDAELDGEATAKALRDAGEADGYGRVEVEFTGSSTVTAESSYGPTAALLARLTDIVAEQVAAYAEAA